MTAVLSGFLLMVGIVVIMGAVLGFQLYKDETNDSIPWIKASIAMILYCVGATVLGREMQIANPDFSFVSYIIPVVLIGIVASILISSFWTNVFKSFNNRLRRRKK